MRSMSAGGSGAPPTISRSSVGNSPPAWSRYSTRSSHTVAIPTPNVTPSALMSVARRRPSVWRPGNTSLAPAAAVAKGTPHALAWNIGTTASTQSRALMAMKSACRARNVCR